jgi:uncharacterized membrane protein YphA (DoxX/SURF4 family)
MRTFTGILSRIFGLFWLVFGLNSLFHFFPIPAPPQDSAYFMEAMARSGYALPMIYGTEVVAGLMLLLGGWKPLALLLVAPITANILAYDMMLNPSGLAIGIVVAVIHAFLLWRSRAAYAPLFECQC